jgi:L-alanine-DL-glutamate epimerase-like enolase superfamily enzyme
MRITDLKECTVPLQGNVTNAVVSFADHTVSLVALVSDQMRNGMPVIGYGFNSIGRFAQSGILNERMFPRIKSAEAASLVSADGSQFDATVIAATAMKNEKPGGHGDRAGALGALELAVWDLNAKLNDEPAYRTIAKYYGFPADRKPATVYAAGGYYYPGASTERLKQELESYRALGFNAFKMKIGGASLKEDMERIEVALKVAENGSKLSVDANGCFDLQQSIEYGSAIAPYSLRWYEEPGNPLDYSLNSELTDSYAGPIATGENLFSLVDTQNLIHFGGMRPNKDIFQMDAGLSYGLTEYAKMVSLLEASGFDRHDCYPHGGHLINLHIAVGLNLGGCEAYPGVFQPFGGYPSECDIGDGVVWPTDAPGFGLEQKIELKPYLDALR